ncbi:regulatory protein GemA [Breoghania sp. JC706]|uniref:regulatory protein GemA n=1 Tax=Breoghania sp. JC706 TaxID=3117732 RepID=UPI00300A27BD
MSAALKAIHAKRRQLDLDDAAYRAILERVTGLRSSRDMREDQRRAVAAELDRLGAPGTPRHRSDRASGPYAPKLQALWIAAHNLGVVRDRSDTAMIAFVKRQTGVDHSRFLHEPADAAKAIEALKKWVRREAGNDDLFRREKGRPALFNDDRFQILTTQWARLVALDAVPAPALAVWMQDRFGMADVGQFAKANRIAAMNELGGLLRAALVKKETPA